MISRAILSLLLFIAGVLHLTHPELFDPAIPFEPKNLINLFSSFLEIALSFGLWPKNFRDHCARASALWFLLLTPVHIYVSVVPIPMFGVAESTSSLGTNRISGRALFLGLKSSRTGLDYFSTLE